MTGFWIAATGLTLLAGLVLMIGAQSGRREQRREAAHASNRVVRRQQIAALNMELAAGAILLAEHRATASEIERSALEEADSVGSTDPGQTTSFDAPRMMTTSWLVMAVAAFAFGLYGFLGNLDGLHIAPPAVAQTASDSTDDGSAQAAVDMLDTMSARMAAQREGTVDAAGWALVARSYAGLQRFDKASEAYSRARLLTPDDAQLLADHADVLAMLQGGHLEDEPARLVARALQLDPRNVKALKLSAVSAPEAFLISGQITVSPAMASRVKATDEVFVFARESGGVGMPFAVARYRAASFPLEFKLDASNIIGGTQRQSGLSKVVLGARISRSGDATPRSGDLRGESSPTSLEGVGQHILIEQMVP